MLEFYFSACLSAAQRVFYTLRDASGSHFKVIESIWWNSLTSDRERARFNGMMNQRDRDVHYGETAAESLPAAIPAEPHEYEYCVQHDSALRRDLRSTLIPTEQK